MFVSEHDSLFILWVAVLKRIWYFNYDLIHLLTSFFTQKSIKLKVNRFFFFFFLLQLPSKLIRFIFKATDAFCNVLSTVLSTCSQICTKKNACLMDKNSCINCFNSNNSLELYCDTYIKTCIFRMFWSSQTIQICMSVISIRMLPLTNYVCLNRKYFFIMPIFFFHHKNRPKKLKT